MNLLDVLLGIALLSALIGGYRVGLVARLAAWVGALGGFLIGLRLLPVVLRRFGDGAPTNRLFLTFAVLLLAPAIGGAIGEVVGSSLRRAVPPGPARSVDHVGGAFIGLAGMLAGLWLMLPMMASVPGSAARIVRTSAILGVLQDVAPRPPNTVNTVRRLVGDTRFPDVFADLRPAPDIGPPPSEIPVSQAVVRRAVASTVNVESFGCGGLHEGSGFTIERDTVVTNAHVVAGSERLRVRRPDGRLITARVVVFDDNRDLAVLSAPGLGLQPLAIGAGREGTSGAVLGYPGGQNTVRVAPALVRREQPAVGRDIYGRDRITRRVLFLASSLRQGDSGAAMIDGDGNVVGVAFAIAPDQPNTAFALDDSELRTVLTAPRRPGVGPCV